MIRKVSQPLDTILVLKNRFSPLLGVRKTHNETVDSLSCFRPLTRHAVEWIFQIRMGPHLLEGLGRPSFVSECERGTDFYGSGIKRLPVAKSANIEG